MVAEFGRREGDSELLLGIERTLAEKYKTAENTVENTAASRGSMR